MVLRGYMKSRIDSDSQDPAADRKDGSVQDTPLIKLNVESPIIEV